jgi:hypothetical protein
MAVERILGDLTFDFSLLGALGTAGRKMKKEHRRRKHVYFSSAIF